MKVFYKLFVALSIHETTSVSALNLPDCFYWSQTSNPLENVNTEDDFNLITAPLPIDATYVKAGQRIQTIYVGASRLYVEFHSCID